MNQKISHSLQRFQEKMNVMRAFGTAQALLSWDRETHMPTGASADRAQAVGTLAGFAHELFTDKKFVHDVEFLFERRTELEPEWQRSLTIVHRELQKSLKLSKKFVEETNQLVNHAQAAWLEAKQQNSFSPFQPFLEKIVDNRQQYAAFLQPETPAYDVLLDEYEEGMTTAFLEPMFRDLRKGLKKILPAIMDRQHAVSNPLDGQKLHPHKLETFLREMASIIGFDWQRGGFGVVEHPFMINISANDFRVNTRFEKTHNSFTITGMIHELGHGIYEQQVDHKYQTFFLDSGVSLGIHESQSRFLENVIGRSPEFWSFFLPRLQKVFPQLKSITVTQVVDALNHVRPSLIRTESDEVTYNVHILLRFELEKALMTNEIAVRDLPDAWRSKMKELLGVEPTTDRDGVLQDVHWAWANFGYFPTYTLGNLNAAQLLKKFSSDHPTWRSEIAEGNFTTYQTWFREHIWQHGSRYKPEELMLKATGEKTNATYFLKYLRDKYLPTEN